MSHKSGTLQNGEIVQTNAFSRPNWSMIAFVFAAVFFCYWPALRGSELWDDGGHITSPELRSISGLWRIWSDLHATQQYYPLLHNCLLDRIRSLGHRDCWLPPGKHTGTRDVGMPPDGCAPPTSDSRSKFSRNVVCVASRMRGIRRLISEQKNTQSYWFSTYWRCWPTFVSTLPYEANAPRDDRMASRRPCSRWQCSPKTVTATLPAALLVIFWWQRGSLGWRRDLRPLVPWFVSAIGYGLLTAWIERTIIGAEGAAFNLSMMQRCLLAGRAVWFYLGKLVWPSNLNFIYPRWDINSVGTGWLRLPSGV